MNNFGIFPANGKINKKEKSSRKRNFPSSHFENSNIADNNVNLKVGATVISIVENRARDVCVAKFDTDVVSI